MDNIHPIILPIACGIWLVAHLNAYIAGSFDAIKEWAKHTDNYKPFYSHHYMPPWYIYQLIIGFALNYLFFHCTGYWQIFVAYYLMPWNEDIYYYISAMLYGWREKRKWPSNLSWLWEDMPNFFKPVVKWIFKTEKVLFQDFINGLINLNALSLIVTIILVLAFYN